MEQIKILRMLSGEDIVAEVVENARGYIVKNAFQFHIKTNQRTYKETVVLDHWLPVSLLQKNEVFLPLDKILFAVEPSDSFSEFYTNTKNMIADVKENDMSSYDESSYDDKLSDEEMNYILDNMESLYGDGSKKYPN